MELQEAVSRVVSRRNLSEEEMVSLMNQVMEGKADPVLLSALLVGLSMKGESVDEIVGAARVMRDKADRLNVSMEPIVDTCGTGGDGKDTFNISTASAFVAAGAGVTIAKHGNRAVTSKSGSADVLKCLGVNIDAEKAVVEKCLEEIGIGFLFAPLLHQAMRHAVEVRKKLGIRTLFNVLGPLTNPAGAQAQVIGVYDKKWAPILARVLKNLGCRRAFIVHGDDGMDEVTLTNYTLVYELNNGNISEFELHPEWFGMKVCAPEDLKGGSPEDNAEIIKQIFAGETGPRADIVLLNAALAITASGKTETPKDGLELARESIKSGAAEKKLADLCRVSHS